MPLRNKVPILLATALGLSACGMLGGRDDAPTIALPAGAALAPDEPLAPPPSRREVSAEEVQSPVPIMPVSSAQGVFQAPQVAVLHPRLPSGSFVEITALDSGRTIAALVAGPYAGPGIVALSPAAAQALGIAEGGPE